MLLFVQFDVFIWIMVQEFLVDDDCVMFQFQGFLSFVVLVGVMFVMLYFEVFNDLIVVQINKCLWLLIMEVLVYVGDEVILYWVVVNYEFVEQQIVLIVVGDFG